MSEFLSVGEAAEELSRQFTQPVLPHRLSNLIYFGKLRSDLCPKIGGRRFIARAYLGEIARVLRRAGMVERREAACV